MSLKIKTLLILSRSAGSEYGSVQAGAKKLTESSYHRGSMDNITSLVIDLSYYRKGSSSSSSSS